MNVFTKYLLICSARGDMMCSQHKKWDWQAEILAYATRHERVLITIDMDFSNIRHYTPKSHKGIIVAKTRPRNANQVPNVLEHLLSNIEVGRLSKSLVIVDQNKYRIR
jgi:predicted nuclease of predicted toxin-antitoxin system